MPGTEDWAGDWLEAFNAHDEERLGALYAEDIHLGAPAGVDIHGRDAAVGFAMAWLNAFPDGAITVHNQVATEVHVVQEFTFTGTHQATLPSPSGEIPATGKRVSGRAAQVFRIANGLAAEAQVYYDQTQILTQLGLVPEPAAA